MALPLAPGLTYMHEHIYIDLSGLKNTDDCRLDNQDAMVSELLALRERGVGNILEVSNIGMGRNVPYMEEVRLKTGINLVYCTGFYQEKFHPPYLKEWPEEQIYALLVKEINQGMDETSVRASVIGEVASSHNLITPTEERLLCASIRAHLETGAAVTTHTTLGTMGREQAALFRRYTKDLSRIVIGHCDLSGSEPYIKELLDTGANIAFDTIGKADYQPEEWRADTLASLVHQGYQGQIVLSMDITRKSQLKPLGGIGYSYLIDSFLPMLRQRGISQEALDDMLIRNPQRILNH